MTIQEPAARPSRARRGEGEKTGDEILDAAEALLLEKGDVDAVSMRAIAKTVGVTAPTIYVHFEDKDGLIQAVCDRRFAQMNVMFEEAEASADDPLGQLYAMGMAYIRFGVENPEPYRLLMMTRTNEDHDVVPHEEPTQGDIAFQKLVGKITECMEAGVFPHQDPLTASLFVWAAVHGLTALMITSPEGYGWPDGIVDSVLAATIRGLGG